MTCKKKNSPVKKPDHLCTLTNGNLAIIFLTKWLKSSFYCNVLLELKPMSKNDLRGARAKLNSPTPVGLQVQYNMEMKLGKRYSTSKGICDHRAGPDVS